MCDQLSTIGIEFSLPRMTSIWMADLEYAYTHPFPFIPSWLRPQWASSLIGPAKPIAWAHKAICHVVEHELKRDPCDCMDRPEHPTGLAASELWAKARPWGLGQIRHPTSVIQLAAGTTVRRPGLSVRVNPDDNRDTKEPLLRTNERIHSCVRVRLACQGLGPDDKEPWPCVALTKEWQLRKGSGLSEAERAANAKFRPKELDLPTEYPAEKMYHVEEGDGEYQWVYTKEPMGTGVDQVPQMKVLPEEPLVGFWERYLLALTAGKPDVWRYAEEHPPFGLGERR
jgi:hypothetical protein